MVRKSNKIIQLTSAVLLASCGNHATFSSLGRIAKKNKTSEQQPNSQGDQKSINNQRLGTSVAAGIKEAKKLYENVIPVSPFAYKKLIVNPSSLGVTSVQDSLPKGSVLVAVVAGPDVVKSLPQNTGFQLEILSGPATAPDGMTPKFTDMIARLTVNADGVTLTDIENVINQTPGFIGAAVPVDFETKTNGDIKSITESLGITSSATRERWKSLLGDEKPLIAIVDTGFDFANQAKILNGDDLANYSPKENAAFQLANQDKNGHGTMMASILVGKNSPAIGVVSGLARILPLKLNTDDSKITIYQAFETLRTAVNYGADVVNFSITAQTKGCDAVAGHMLFRAMEKDVFVVMAAGNGRQDFDDSTADFVGRRLIQAPFEGLSDFRPTESPACWGLNLKGSVAVSAFNASTVKGPDFANYGKAIELLAPGVDAPMLSLGGNHVVQSGTSAATAYTTGAAALVVGFLKKQKWTYTAWYVKDFLLNGSVPTNNLNLWAVDGRIVNYEVLAAYAEDLMQKPEDERRALKTIIHRTGTGWNPGVDLSPFKSLELVVIPQTLTVGQSGRVQAKLFYTDGHSEDVSDKVIWSAVRSGIDISSDGRIVAKKKGEYRLSAHYRCELESTKCRDISAESLKLEFKEPKAVVLQKITVEGATSVDFGLDLVRFRAINERSFADGSKDQVEWTSSCNWSSSAPLEFKLTSVPGAFSTTEAFGGRTYTVTANCPEGSSSLTTKVKLAPARLTFENPKVGPEFTQGQKFSVLSHFTAPESVAGTGPDARAKWMLDGKVITEADTRVEIDTTSLSIGKHTLSATSVYRGNGSLETLSVSYDFTVTLKIKDILLSLDAISVQELKPTQAIAQALYTNNQTEVINNKVTWTSSNPSLLSIEESGRVTPNKGSAGKTFTVTATYLGTSRSLDIAVQKTSSVTGSGSKIVAFEGVQDLELDYSEALRKNFIRSGVVAVYEDGTKRNVEASALITPPLPEVILGNTSFNIALTYNDGNTNGGAFTAAYTVKIKAEGRPICQLNLKPSPAENVFGEGLANILQPMADLPNMYHWTIGVINATNLKTGNTVSTNSLTVGKYKLRGDCTWGGSGKIENYSSVDYILEITPRTAVSLEFGSNKGPWIDLIGSRWFQLKDKNNNSMGIKLDELEGWLEKPDGTKFGQKYLRPRYNTVYFDFSDLPFGTSFRLVVKHKPTGLTTHADYRTFSDLSVDSIPKWNPHIFADIPQPDLSLRDASYCNTTRLQSKPFAGGTGTVEDPYRICNATQLLAMNQTGTHYRLMSDIDMTGINLLAGTAYSLPMPAEDDASDYAYTVRVNASMRSQGGLGAPKYFDGNGYAIANLTMTDAERDQVGLFTHMISYEYSAIGSVAYREMPFVTNLILKKFNIRGRDNVGTLAGRSWQFDVQNVYVFDSQVRGISSVGGLTGTAGNLNRIKVRNVTVMGSKENIGGVAGKIERGDYIDVYRTSKLTGMLNDFDVEASIIVNESSDYRRQRVGGIFGFVEDLSLPTKDVDYASFVDHGGFDAKEIDKIKNDRMNAGSYYGTFALTGKQFRFRAIQGAKFKGTIEVKPGGNAEVTKIGGLFGATTLAIADSSFDGVLMSAGSAGGIVGSGVGVSGVNFGFLSATQSIVRCSVSGQITGKTVGGLSSDTGLSIFSQNLVRATVRADENVAGLVVSGGFGGYSFFDRNAFEGIIATASPGSTSGMIIGNETEYTDEKRFTNKFLYKSNYYKSLPGSSPMKGIGRTRTNQKNIDP